MRKTVMLFLEVVSTLPPFLPVAAQKSSSQKIIMMASSTNLQQNRRRRVKWTTGLNLIFQRVNSQNFRANVTFGSTQTRIFVLLITLLLRMGTSTALEQRRPLLKNLSVSRTSSTPLTRSFLGLSHGLFYLELL